MQRHVTVQYFSTKTFFIFLLDKSVLRNLPKEEQMSDERAAGLLSLFTDYWNRFSSSPVTYQNFCARDCQEFTVFHTRSDSVIAFRAGL